MSKDVEQPAKGEDAHTHFGFRDVDARLKQGLVNDVFARVADRYDLMNDLMSGGLHRLWKDDVINWLAPPKGERRHRLLDVAGGTGDIVQRYLRAGGDGCRALVCDISGEMLAAGRDKLGRHVVGGRAEFLQGNGEALPLRDGSFDAYTIAFGIRNVTHLDRALDEAYRVLKPGGRFLCLEFSEVDVPFLESIYDAWSFQVIPRIGELAAGDGEPYRYLVESIRRFPNQERFAAMIGDAGFERVRFRNLTGGIAAIHSGWRL
ncbi:MAG: bifunctional demethylmenaquinone methyltransferase/2-methoxy-6-polyprenyl-1,4-benzoquinol methylase UbiE [Hyphomicrobiaceae bacterium]